MTQINDELEKECHDDERHLSWWSRKGISWEICICYLSIYIPMSCSDSMIQWQSMLLHVLFYGMGLHCFDDIIAEYAWMYSLREWYVFSCIWLNGVLFCICIVFSFLLHVNNSYWLVSSQEKRGLNGGALRQIMDEIKKMEFGILRLQEGRCPIGSILRRVWLEHLRLGSSMERWVRWALSSMGDRRW
mgnify:CR=1 FL=1